MKLKNQKITEIIRGSHQISQNNDNIYKKNRLKFITVCI